MKKGIIFVVLAGGFLFIAYHALMYYDKNFRYGRMRETPAVRPYEKPLLTMEAGLVPFNGGEAIYRAMDDEKLKSPLQQIDSVSIEQGKKGYFTYCAQCHGTYFDGNGTVGQSFAPLPTDLRSTRVQKASDGYLFKHVSYGIGGSGRQPALATTVSIEERWKIVVFIKSLGSRK